MNLPYKTVEELTVVKEGHELNFFAYMDLSSEYEPGDIYRGKIVDMPVVLKEFLTLPPTFTNYFGREYVLVYKPEGEYSRTFKPENKKS